MSSKIIKLEELADQIESYKAEGKKVVHCHGVFDLLHIGHIKHFQSARAKGDVLIVTLTPDKLVKKGPGRPAFTEKLRMEAIASLDAVDHVALNRWATAVEAIKLLKPNCYVKGSEYRNAADDPTGGIALEREAIESVGGSLQFTDDVVFSSSNLINKYIDIFPKEAKDYLKGFRQRYSAKNVLNYMDGARKLKVLVIGETIIDEYRYCEAIGKSSKEPTLAVRALRKEEFAGGVLAVANHIADFAGKTSLLSMLGEVETREDFIKGHLDDRVEPIFMHRSDSPTIIKTRIIEHYFFTKMLEVYTINDSALAKKDNDQLCRMLEEEVQKYDVVIVVDFGHSMISPRAVNIISEKAKFLALNSQANAGNMGYNVVTKYPRADFISLAEKEMRLASHDLRGDMRPMMEKMSKKMNCRRIVVTRGSTGSLCYCREEGFMLIPALASEVVDRVGAGDASLSMASLCAAQNAPLEVVGFIGNAAGAYVVSTVCNKEPITRPVLFKQVECLLK
jgi:rfaE bifunctional protein kinase chain/domain/rfaE bifunctional protein nucleotidyltransferase chain/domain